MPGIFLVALVVLAGCKDPNNSGIEVLEDDDLVSPEAVDSFTIRMETFPADSIYTWNLGRGMFGEYLDPDFGEVRVTQYTEFQLTGSSVTFGADPTQLTLDSLFLGLDLSGFYGRYNEPLDLEVFRIMESFPEGDTLWSNSTLDIDTTLNYAAGQQLDFSALGGYLDFVRIRLDDSLGRFLLHTPVDSLANNTVFKQRFKGLAIRAKATRNGSREPGCIFYTTLNSARTGLGLVYHDGNVAKNYTFNCGSSTKHFYHTERRNYSSKLISTVLADVNTPQPMYAMSQAGAFLKIYLNIPALKTLDLKAIHRANLFLYVDPASLGPDEYLKPPASLLLYTADTDRRTADNPGFANSEGGWEPAKYRYNFSLTNTLAQINNGTLSNNGFILVPDDGNTTLNRVTLGNLGHPTLKPRLQVVFTSVPH